MHIDSAMRDCLPRATCTITNASAWSSLRRIHNAAYFSTWGSGVPDIICCYRGRFLGLEVKLPHGRLTALQKRALEKINRAGGIARRVESVDDVKAVIAQADRETKEVGTP